MKKLIVVFSICFAFFSISMSLSSCTTLQESQMTGLLRERKNAVLQCAPGYHWDDIQGKCVPNDSRCPDGQHWDPVAGGCIPNCPPGHHYDPQAGECVADSISVITNPNNPYDYTGADHNEAVNAIFPNINPSAQNVDSVIEVQVKKVKCGYPYAK